MASTGALGEENAASLPGVFRKEELLPPDCAGDCQNQTTLGARQRVRQQGNARKSGRGHVAGALAHTDLLPANVQSATRQPVRNSSFRGRARRTTCCLRAGPETAPDPRVSEPGG